MDRKIPRRSQQGRKETRRMWLLGSQNKSFREEGRIHCVEVTEALNKLRAKNGWLHLAPWRSSVISARELSFGREVA